MVKNRSGVKEGVAKMNELNVKQKLMLQMKRENAFEYVRKMRCMRRSWLYSEVLLHAVKKIYEGDDTVSSRDFLTALSKSAKYGVIQSDNNETGVFSRWRKMEAPNGVRKKCVFFWIGNEGEKPHDLSSWHTTIDLNAFRNRRINKEGFVVEDGEMVEVTKLEKVSTDPWDSRIYKKLYGALEGKDIGESINEMLDVLEEGLKGNYRSCVLDFTEESDISFVTKHAILRVHHKCMYLSYALECAYEKYKQKTAVFWKDCCRRAVNELEHLPMGLDPVKDPRTVERWFVDFRDSGCRLVIPALSMQKRKEKKMPEIFEVFPEFKEAVIEFIDSNLGDMSLDIAHDYMNKCINVIIENDEIFQSEIKMENESDDENDGSIARQVTKLRSNLDLQESLKQIGTSYFMSEEEKQQYNKSLLLKGLVPAASSARDRFFSAKLENNAATDQNSSSSRVSSDELTAHCAMNDAQQAENSSRMTPPYICMGTGMSKRVKTILKNRKIGHTTAHEWMTQLGYRYKDSTKCYYSDAHERDDVVRYRVKFIRRYLHYYEPYTPRWIQIELPALEKMVEGKEMDVDVSDWSSKEKMEKNACLMRCKLKDVRAKKVMLLSFMLMPFQMMFLTCSTRLLTI